MSKLTFL